MANLSYEMRLNRQHQEADRLAQVRANRAAKAKAKQVAAKNAAFAALSPEAQRVAIAQDVLDGLASKQVRAMSGTYVRLYDGDPGDYNGVHKSQAERLNGYTCQVCALGALFVCATERTPITIKETFSGKPDEVTYGMFSDRIRDALSPYFSHDQLLAVEAAFEETDMDSSIDSAARSFGRSAGYDDGERMEAIMRNIIENNGTFKP